MIIVTTMVAVTPPPACLSILDDLLDRERSRRFHAGVEAIDPLVAERLMAALPDLQRPPVCVHVAGSEGKTSTTERIGLGLRACGLSVGTYTSPHLRDVRERLRIDGAFPADDELCAAVDVVAAAARELSPSWFEFLTALARVLFVPPRVQAAVWETGLGGRLDATRHLPADLAVITSISLEHTAILGDTLAAIATEKAGILRPGAPVVVSATLPDEARAVLDACAADGGCAVVVADDALDDLDARSVALARAVLATLEERALLPAGAATSEAVEAALTTSRVAGRLHEIDGVLFDGAHTVAAAGLLAAHLARLGAAGRTVGALVFGATSGRDGGAMVAALAATGIPMVLTRAPGERGLDPADLWAACPDATLEADPERALALARRQAGPDALVVVTGSLHLVGLLLPEAPALTEPPSGPAPA